MGTILQLAGLVGIVVSAFVLEGWPGALGAISAASVYVGLAAERR